MGGAGGKAKQLRLHLPTWGGRRKRKRRRRRHIHLIVEAQDERALARGMQGLGVRIAKALNRLMGRKGTVFADHYHARQLRSPTQVANALAYVLMNFLRHFPEEARRFAANRRDRFSSAWHEQGRDPPVVRARTWLLGVGWRWRAAPELLPIVDDAGDRAPSVNRESA